MKKALTQIHADLTRLIANASDGEPVDVAELRIIARKVEAQREMLEQGLATVVEAS